ncbi:hypothetical protein FACS189413_14160 [Bacteroidia bacterium]|nr:hypothetical protein FACS189413_14160 [Bacteroidia bacterium]
MQKVLTILFLGFVVMTQAQEVSTKKSNWGVQVGIPIISIYHESKLFDSNRDLLDGNSTNGILFYNELKLTDRIVLKTEGGLGGYFREYNHVRLLLTPTIAIEPRFYITK